MSERERWVVYPLLFLALGAALRDKLFDRTTTKSIVCEELTVVDEEPIGGQPLRIIARIGRSESTPGRSSSGYLIVNGQVDVNGLVNAQQYAFRGVPFGPAWQGIFPWSANPMRAPPSSARPPQQQPGSTDATPPQANSAAPAPPATGENNSQSDAQPAARSESSAEPPLADPKGNR